MPARKAACDPKFLEKEITFALYVLCDIDANRSAELSLEPSLTNMTSASKLTVLAKKFIQAIHQERNAPHTH